MLCKSNKTFAPLKKGTNVLIQVPDADSGHLTPRNILAIVSGINDDGFYELSTENGPLDRLFSRNELLQTNSQFMPEADNIYDKKISLRTAANMSSKGSGQGFLRCNCKKFCGDNKSKNVDKSKKVNKQSLETHCFTFFYYKVTTSLCGYLYYPQCDYGRVLPTVFGVSHCGSL
nr:unnamed protein product [Callosobruchus analis]